MLDSGFYVQILTGMGAIILMTAWIPMALRKMPLSLPIFCVAIGAALFTMPRLRPFAVHPLQYPVLVERLSEFVVVVALMGAGLKIDRLVGLRRWVLTWRLGLRFPLSTSRLRWRACPLEPKRLDTGSSLT